MAQVKITVNGTEVTADDEKTILQVVRENDLDEIPTLCYEERLGQISSCFLCVVEVEGARGLVPSCSTKIRDKMVIRTNTPLVKETRKMCLELLFSDHYADCISPCSQKCPAGVDIQGYLGLIKQGLFAEAVELIKQRNPLPIVCGRVCVRECEVACRRNLLDEPVAIDFLKRYAAETREGIRFKPEVKPPIGKSVAIVGAGPAGLSAAYYLAVEGYDVTIFEAMPQPGGMLRYGIPAYRLPRDLLNLEIDSIRQLGVEIHCNRRLGKDFTLTDLKQQHDAVLLAMGAWGAMGLRAENADHPNVLSGLDVLRQASMGEIDELKGRVLVIGGGNTAIDASRTAVRLGADEVVILYRRSEEQMPAHKEEVEDARAEGVKIKFLVSPTRVVTDDSGKLTGLECIRMKLGEPDSSGRPRPIPIEGSNYVEPCDYVLAAIGQYPDLKCLESGGNGECKVSLNKRGRIVIDEKNMQTNVPGVFSSGDVVTGPATVIEGIAAGRKAALAIHSQLGNGKPEREKFLVRKDMFAQLTCEDLNCFECPPRHQMPKRDPKERVKDFGEVELGLSRENTIDETKRCLECGCLKIDDCLLRKYAEDYGIDPVHYRGEINRYQVDRSHPFIIIDPNKCIQCGRCIKTCENILESSALGFVNRGFKTLIAPAMEKPLLETNCIACGNCIDSCPTGAISENQPLMALIEDRLKNYPAVCSFCPVGCNIEVKAFGRDVRIRSNRDKMTGEGDYLCQRGRFGSRYLNSKDRIQQPAIKLKGRIHYTEWEKVISKTAKNLKEVREKYGPDSIAVFVSPKLTNEEIYAAVKLSRGVIGTDFIGSYRDLLYGRNQHELDEVVGYTVSTNPMDDVENTDIIILLNSNPMETHPTFGWKIRQASRQGAKVIVINSNRIDPVRHADAWLQPLKGTSTHLLNAVMQEIISSGSYDKKFVNERTSGYPEFADFLKKYSKEEVSGICGVREDKIKKAAQLISSKDTRVMLVYDMDSFSDRATGDLKAAAGLLLLTGNFGKRGRGLILLQKHANTVGLYDMGCEPGYLPGRTKVEDKNILNLLEKTWGAKIPASSSTSRDDLRSSLVSGKIKAALVIGEDPLENPADLKYLRSLEFMAVVDLFETETTRRADVLMPASTCIESGGTYTRLDRKIQKFPGCFDPPAGMTNLEIICQLAKEMGKPLGFENPNQVFEEIKKVNVLYSAIEPDSDDQDSHFWNPVAGKCKCGYLYCKDFATVDGKARLSVYPVETTTYVGAEFEYNAIEKRYRDWINHLFMKDRTISVPV